MEMLQTIPIFRIFDLAKAREFYVTFLGFHIDWEHQFEGVSPHYLQVSRAGLVLHLTEHHGDCCPGSTLFVRMAGLAGFHQELIEKQYGFLRPGVEETFYGTRCMEVIDPFGNRIRFNEDVLPTDTKVG
jgi:catechol 2,3-dioxygenase-like lactoylglutathione lyase family enzyme